MRQIIYRECIMFSSPSMATLCHKKPWFVTNEESFWEQVAHFFKSKIDKNDIFPHGQCENFCKDLYIMLSMKYPFRLEDAGMILTIGDKQATVKPYVGCPPLDKV